jgi:hypothetical protein
VAGGAGQVLLGHDGVEDAEQVQVKRKKAHGIRSAMVGYCQCTLFPFTINIRPIIERD